MTDKEKIHELEQQVIDMAIEIVRLKSENEDLSNQLCRAIKADIRINRKAKTRMG